MPIDPTIIPSENNTIQSVLGPITPASLTEIITQFNQENDFIPRASILKNLNSSGFSIFKHRMPPLFNN